MSTGDQCRQGVIDPAMQRLEKMMLFQKPGNPVERFIVDQDRAQKGLFRLDIMRRDPIVDI